MIYQIFRFERGMELQINDEEVAITFRRLDVNRYMITFLGTDKHTPDMITWIMKQYPEYKDKVGFVATKRHGLGEDDNIEMEIHLEKLCDVTELIANAANQAAKSVGQLKNAFEEALTI